MTLGTSSAPRPRAGRRCGFVPPYLLRRLGREQTLSLDAGFRAARPGLVSAPPPLAARATPAWTVHDAGATTTLPGRPVRRAGEGATGDPAVDEAATGIAASLALFADVYGRDSYDDAGAPVSLTVHYGRDYANAFWDGTQLVFGDGDGEVFGRFTAAVDVLAHELAHAVTERSAGLVYQGQSGALNESVSDVFAACLAQRLLGQSPQEADWLIGADIFLPGVAARGLRDMRAPGTAYDDPRLGTDPQPGHLDDYVETSEDNGGVHLNSGIPNRAFQLAAVAVGGSSAEGAGAIWYAALTGGRVGPRTDFAGFAAATVAAAGVHADAVGAAWEEVGVTPRAGGGRAGEDGAVGRGADPGRRLTVRRTGGFAGLRAEADLDLDADDDPRAAEARSLLERVDLAAAAARAVEPGGADRFVYDVDVAGTHVRVPEQALGADLARLVEVVLRPPQDPA